MSEPKPTSWRDWLIGLLTVCVMAESGLIFTQQLGGFTKVEDTVTANQQMNIMQNQRILSLEQWRDVYKEEKSDEKEWKRDVITEIKSLNTKMDDIYNAIMRGK